MYKLSMLIEAPDMFSSHILAIDDIGKVLSQTIPNNHSVIIDHTMMLHHVHSEVINHTVMLGVEA